MASLRRNFVAEAWLLFLNQFKSLDFYAKYNLRIFKKKTLSEGPVFFSFGSNNQFAGKAANIISSVCQATGIPFSVYIWKRFFCFQKVFLQTTVNLKNSWFEPVLF